MPRAREKMERERVSKRESVFVEEKRTADVVAGCKKRIGNERTQQRESACKRSARAVVKTVI